MIDSCRVINIYPVFEGRAIFESHNRRLIYALIRAEDEIQAMEYANRLISEYLQGNEG